MARNCILGFLVSVLFLSFVRSDARADAESGRVHYVRYCSSCHGLDGTGEGPAAVALRTIPPDLTKISERNGGTFPASDVMSYVDGQTRVAAHGSRQMPVWGEQFGKKAGGGEIGEEVARGKIQVIVDYLKSIQKK